MLNLQALSKELGVPSVVVSEHSTPSALRSGVVLYAYASEKLQRNVWFTNVFFWL